MTVEAFGKCACCFKLGPLCNSHSIPDAFFRKIRSQNDGHMLQITRGDANLKKTSEKGGTYLLCEACENLFNKKFDQYLVAKFRLIRNIYESGENTEISIDPERTLRSILSVFWRASQSDEAIFEHLDPSLGGKPLKKLLFDGHIKLIDHLGCLLCIVEGISKSGAAVSTDQSMRQLIIPPFLSPPVSLSAKGRGVKYRMIAMVAEGIYALVMIPRPGYPKNRVAGFMNARSRSYQPARKPLLELPFASDAVLEIFEAAYWADQSDHSASSS